MGHKPPLSADSSEAWAEQAFANIYGDYVTTQLRLSDLIEDTSIRAHLAVVDSASEKAYANRTLPDEIFTNNMYVHQVLSLILKEKGETERAEKLLPLHTFLEFGASDRALINLNQSNVLRAVAHECDPLEEHRVFALRYDASTMHALSRGR
jgi:hypothetical protein